jgi:hypothetical protein
MEEAEKNIVKILAAKEQAKQDAIKAFTYQSGMAAPKAQEEQDANDQSLPKKKGLLYQSAHYEIKRATKEWELGAVFFYKGLESKLKGR